MEVRPTRASRDSATRRLPTRMGTWNSTRSMATVTQSLLEWRMAHTPAALSTISRTLPPNTVPTMLALPGRMKSARTVAECSAVRGLIFMRAPHFPL
ncbi:MAG: hypothetical protein A2X36_10330 [Elusimicrobia bacterium GWA2_69_24]|nr:MAG: hypothetical protein A2X36_10330 [Elusimicrobia bacterium GWA2_69_24]